MSDGALTFVTCVGFVVSALGIGRVLWAIWRMVKQAAGWAKALREIASHTLLTGEDYIKLVMTNNNEKLVLDIINQNRSLQYIAKKALDWEDEKHNIEKEETALRTKYSTLHPFRQGQKVGYEGKVYDFGYISDMGYAILYEEGECNMQDSIAVEPWEVKKL